MLHTLILIGLLIKLPGQSPRHELLKAKKKCDWGLISLEELKDPKCFIKPTTVCYSKYVYGFLDDIFLKELVWNWDDIFLLYWIWKVV